MVIWDEFIAILVPWTLKVITGDLFRVWGLTVTVFMVMIYQVCQHRAFEGMGARRVLVIRQI